MHFFIVRLWPTNALPISFHLFKVDNYLRRVTTRIHRKKMIEHNFSIFKSFLLLLIIIIKSKIVNVQVIGNKNKKKSRKLIKLEKKLDILTKISLFRLNY